VEGASAWVGMPSAGVCVWGGGSLTALQDVVLSTGVNDRLIVGKATQADPAGSSHDIAGSAGSLLTLGDRV
jgi:hypothetical protein